MVRILKKSEAEKKLANSYKKIHNRMVTSLLVFLQSSNFDGVANNYNSTDYVPILKVISGLFQEIWGKCSPRKIIQTLISKWNNHTLLLEKLANYGIRASAFEVD